MAEHPEGRGSDVPRGPGGRKCSRVDVVKGRGAPVAAATAGLSQRFAGGRDRLRIEAGCELHQGLRWRPPRPVACVSSMAPETGLAPVASQIPDKRPHFGHKLSGFDDTDRPTHRQLGHHNEKRVERVGSQP